MRCVVGMSGGVDSSTSAALMKERGFDVVGCTFKMFESEKSAAAINNAKKVADFLKIDHEVVDCVNEFKKSVMDYFVMSYENGYTPNPCVMCNKFVKFKYLDDFRRKCGADILVTGHYAQLKKTSSRVELFQAEELEKDQSYFLYGVNRDILMVTEFPLGGHHKSHTRELARGFGIHVSEQPESQDICFILNGNYIDFVKEHSSKICVPGDLVDESGNIVGKHSGIINYTIGQRRGLGLSGGPFFVSDLDAKDYRVIVSDKEGVRVEEILLSGVNFLNEEYLGECEVKIRSANKKTMAVIMKTGGDYCVKFLEPEYGIARDQHCVFYVGNMLLGGGVICEALPIRSANRMCC
jgi:tRNA-specific 2-thiouridylase